MDPNDEALNQVGRVEGCNCGGRDMHRTDCSLWNLPHPQAMKLIEDAKRRRAEFIEGLNAQLQAAFRIPQLRIEQAPDLGAGEVEERTRRVLQGIQEAHRPVQSHNHTRGVRNCRACREAVEVDPYGDVVSDAGRPAPRAQRPDRREDGIRGMNWYWYMNQGKVYYDFEIMDRVQIEDMTRNQADQARNWLMFMGAQIAELYNTAELELLRDQLFRVENPYVDDVPIKAVKGSHGDPEWRKKSPGSWLLGTPIYAALTERLTSTSS